MTENRPSRWPGMLGMAGAGTAVVTVATIALYLAGGLEWAERHLMDLRFALQHREPTGEVVVVAIDPKSLSSLDAWPWPREYHATVLQNLLAAGAARVAFDIDFSSSSTLEQDAALEQEMQAAGGRVVLPVFHQWQPQPEGGQRLVMTRPLPALAARATLASINIQPDSDGLVRRYGISTALAAGSPPSMATTLASTPASDGNDDNRGDRPFYLDYGIDVEAIPVVSYLDVLTGMLPAGAVSGKTVIVGATALELGDRAPVPLHAAVPGPTLQALAFESLRSGRALTRLPAWLVVAMTVMISLGAGIPMQRLSWRVGLGLLVTGWSLLFVAALVVQRSAPIIVDIAPGGAALAGCFGLALMRRIDQQEMKAWVALLKARQVELRMRHVVENCSEAIVTLDEQGRIETFNRAAEALFGSLAPDVVARPFGDLVSGFPQQPDETAAQAVAAPPESTVRHQRAIIVRPDGQSRWLEYSVSSFRPDGRSVRVVFLEDVTESLGQQQRLLHQATHDALTDLPNRTLIFDRIRHALGDQPGAPRRAAVLMLDLDRFKEINDTLGHATGDRLLRDIAERLRTRLGSAGMIARLGGDEFAVLLPDAGRAQAESVAARLAETLAAPFELEGMSLQVEVSIGVALCPEHGREPGLLLQRADVAMYLAKRQRVTMCLYDPGADANSLKLLTLHGELRDAIQQNGLELHYQPKLELATETVVGAEALLRWNHPRHGMLSPVEFIPMAERTGLIKPLTHWVIRRALMQAAAWEAKGVTLPVSVNCSARNLLEEDLPDTIDRLLCESKVAASRLMLEITETAIIEDPGRSLRVLKELAARGIGLSIDDFGTAYSSLDYLRKLPATELKIDRSFVTGVDRDAGDATIVRATVRLARDFGLQAVAEGIESSAVMDMLRELGCHQGQGHFISPPIPAGEFFTWHLARLRKRLAGRAAGVAASDARRHDDGDSGRR